jgi:hypothetical protein
MLEAVQSDNACFDKLFTAFNYLRKRANCFSSLTQGKANT